MHFGTCGGPRPGGSVHSSTSSLQPSTLGHNLSSSPPPPTYSMFASSQTAGSSTNNFTVILNAASTEYHRVTGRCLDTHPFSAQLNTCNTPEAVLNIFRTQAHAFSKFRKGDERLMAWLDPIVHILFVFSGTLGEGVGLVNPPVHCLWLSSNI